jgi:hypothetical protein
MNNSTIALLKKTTGKELLMVGDNIIVNPHESYLNMKMTRVMSAPCLLLMLVFSLLLVYVILKHLRTLLYLYASVLFYAWTQV